MIAARTVLTSTVPMRDSMLDQRLHYVLEFSQVYGLALACWDDGVSARENQFSSAWSLWRETDRGRAVDDARRAVYFS